MKKPVIYLVTALTILAHARTISGQPDSASCAPLLDFEVPRLGASEPERLCERFRGKVVLVVNTASRCAFTPQYEALEQLYREKSPQGLAVVGFPSNDFAGQEPGSEEEIADFCRINYGVSFPMYGKLHVRGDRAHPFFLALSEASGQAPRWNFHKYLIGRDGRLIDQYSSWTTPDNPHLRGAIEEAL